MRRSPAVLRILQVVTVLALLAGSSRSASAATIVLQIANSSEASRVAQVFPDQPTYTSFEFDDFATLSAYYITTLTAFGDELGDPSFNIAVTGEIWSGLPGLGGVLVMSGTGTQIGEDLVINFGGQLLQAGSYWLTAYVTRSFIGGGQWFWDLHDPVSGSQSYFYNPGGGFGWGTLPVPGGSSIGTAQDMAFQLEGELTAVPEPASLTLIGIGAFGLLRRRMRRANIAG